VSINDQSSALGGISLHNNKLAVVRIVLFVLLAFTSLTSARAELLEPRYWWERLPDQLYSTPDEAFAAHKAAEAANNANVPPAERSTAIGYEVVGSPGTSYWLVNGLPSGYQIRFIRPIDCPNSCLAGVILLKPECPVGTRPTIEYPGGGVQRVYCEEFGASEPDRKECPVGGPIYPSTGTKWKEQTDYDSGPGNLRFSRIYRSDRKTWTNNYDVGGIDFASVLGTPNSPSQPCRVSVGTTTGLPYCFRYFSLSPSTDFAVKRGDGHTLHFNKTTGLPALADSNDRLTRVTNGSGVTLAWDYYDSLDDSVHRFDTVGRLQTITARNGAVQTLSYSDVNTAPAVAPYPGLLVTVTDHTGKQLNFTYDAQGRMKTMINPAGGVTTYGYDEASSIVVPGKLPASNLTSVTYPDQTQRIYWYNEQDKTDSTNLPFALTGITDESGVRYGTYKYDTSGRGISTELAGGAEKYTFTYTNTQSVVTDPLGTQRTYNYSFILSTKKRTSVTSPCTSGCSTDAATSYDANANVASRTDFNGNKICYAYDLARNLETARLEGVASGVSCPANLATYMPTANTRQRKITTQWHATYRLPTQIDEAGKRTTFTHDANGNILTRTELDTSTSASRTWTYTYNSFGEVLTVDGPRTDISHVTTYTYYSCTTGHQCGRVHTVTNAAGHITTYNTYNAHGQPLTITEPNGAVTTLTYDLRQRLSSRGVGSDATTFEYWPTGLLKKVTLPDSSYLQYTYDDAHRLTGLTDSEGNRIHYTLDLMGNRTGEQAYDPSNSLTRTRTRVFNSLNHLYQEIGAAGTANVTTTFGYDNNGNQTSIVAPLGRDSVQAYDELNRLKQVTDPLNGVTKYGYNALDQLISVTDPRNLVTSYSYNALGDLGQQTSPDTGVTINTYDSGGNLATSTDARLAVATYTYDSLNRVATSSFASGSTTDPTLTYSYDSGSYGKGHLTGISDSNHSLSWTYDAQGRVLTAGQTVGLVSKSTSYSYANGLRQSMTTPSGQVIAYTYTNGKVTSIQVNGTLLVSNILYDPFGPVRQWTWSNGSLAVRTYDEDGKVTQIDSEVLKTYSYDDAFRITGITDASNTALSWTYGYDDLDRLTNASKTGATLGYSYDANGNRLTQTGTSASTFTIAANNNRLSSTSGALTRTYGYDNSGNTTSFTGLTFTYNNRGRMSSSTKNGVNTSYTYNGLGQLIKKGANTLYYYDEAGHILGTYTGTGALVEEIVWSGDTPIVSLRPRAAGGVSIYNIHTDHLNTPRLITGSVNPGIRWRWDADPFGVGTVNNNPSGAGVFDFHLRSPGQIFVAETGLNYNYYRDGYDPVTGRYTQSDPVGLSGGLNTYTYVSANPISFIDPFGLTALEFDIASGRLRVDPEVPGRKPYEIDATSGRGKCENKPECERRENEGPIPRGSYYIDPNQIDNPPLLDDLRRNFRTPRSQGGGDWGDWRVRIYPNPGTQRFGRTGFYLHGGYFDGSAGCIDIGGGIFGDDRLLKDLLRDPDGRIPLRVR
jgi:RHS repeat-associated protein